MKKLLNTLKTLDWERIAPSIIAVLFTVGIFYDSLFADHTFLKLLWIIIGVLITILILFVFVTAGFSVIKTLVKVSVGLTLIIFIGQSYCESVLMREYRNFSGAI